MIEQLRREDGATGGRNSKCFIIQNKQGEKAFMKVLDLSDAIRSADQVYHINKQTSAFVFERKVLEKCRAGRTKRVALPIASGQIEIDPMLLGGTLPYLIFDLADGDVRKQLEDIGWLDFAWIMRSLHHVATGLMQLHNQGIAHQDTKPSNLLVYPDRTTKIADLGCASTRDGAAPLDDHTIAGDLSYAAPEQLYGHLEPDWSSRRIGCDLYHLGSLMVFLLAGSTMTALLSSELDPTHHWRSWRGPYVEVLAYVREAFNRAVIGFSQSAWAEIVGPKIAEEITQMVRELCELDPKLRGHPANRQRGMSQYSLQWAVSRLDVIASRIESNLY